MACKIELPFESQEKEVLPVRHRAFLLAVVTVTLGLSPLFLARAAGAPQAAKAQGSSTIPDFSGVWFFQGGDVRANFDFGKSSPLLPWAEERLKANQQKLNTILLCYPAGVPRVWTQPHPFEIISLPGRVLIYYEFQHTVRQIHTDGREHPKDLIPTFMGDSIGKWEGDTLVVDTIGFNDQTWLDNSKRPLSDALHVVERIRRVSHDVLQVDITIDDPKAFAKPWSVTRSYDLKPDWEITEHVCEENNTYLVPNENPK
jgi:hypothetical protein